MRKNTKHNQSEIPRIQLMNGDCLRLLAKIPEQSVDLILTDPPYNLGLFMKKRATNLQKMRENFFGAANWDNLDYETWKTSLDEFFKAAAKSLKKGGSLVVFMAIIKVETVIAIAEKNGFYYKTTGIWHKLNPMPRNMNLHFVNSTESWIYFTYQSHTGTFNNNGSVIHDFVETSLTTGNEKKKGKHPTQKPVPLMKHFVRLLSNEDDVVLDPFMGSGSTGVAALEANRKFIGMELNPEYFAIAENRIKEVLV